MFNADVPEEDIIGAIQRVTDKFEHEDFSFQLNKAGGGYQFLTKPAYQASIGIMLKQQSKKIVYLSNGNTFHHCLQTACI